VKTEFDIKFIEDFKDCKTITFIDQTIYNPNIPVTTPVLRVTLPHFNKYVDLDYIPSKVNFVNTKVLGLNVGCLNDGIWTFELSICPNDKLKKSFKYFNICNAMSLISTELCSDSSEENLLRLKDIKDQLQLVQLMCDEKKAYAMYDMLIKKIHC
jgi:hypothetical protein